MSWILCNMLTPCTVVTAKPNHLSAVCKTFCMLYKIFHLIVNAQVNDHGLTIWTGTKNWEEN